MSRYRFNQIIFTMLSVLMLAGSGILIALGPSPYQPSSMPEDRISEGESSTGESSTDESLDDYEVAADALTPENSLEESSNRLENRESEFGPSNPVLDRAAARRGSSLNKGDSRGLPDAGLLTLRQIPVSDSEVESAWKQAASMACEAISPNEPFEITRPTPFLTDNDRRQATQRTLTPGMRQHMLSIGLHLPRKVEQSLPMLSKIPIMDYIRRHYVTIQARVHRDPVTGIPYLHQRPLAGTIQYSGSRMTLEFTDTVARSVNDFRSLGLWLGPDEDPTPQNLRTLVLVDRYETGQSGLSSGRSKAAFELMFVRARFKNKRGVAGDQAESKSNMVMDENGVSNLILHTFVTTNGRQTLHYIAPDAEVRDSQQCGIRVLVQFTSYAHGAYPTGSVVIGQEVRSKMTYSEDKINRFARQKGWKGGRFAHLSQLLDAIIDKQLAAN